jgi:pimeloyl-ACP methyl ester carboxylesterase
MRNRKQFEGGVGDEVLDRREILRRGVALAGASSLAFSALGRAGGQRAMDARSEAKKLAFDRTGKGAKVLLISGFPQTRRSWNRLVPLLSQKFETIPADLPSFGDSGILDAPATTENAGRVFHEFVTKKYDWMNRIIAVGAGVRLPDGPVYSIFEVL